MHRVKLFTGSVQLLVCNNIWCFIFLQDQNQNLYNKLQHTESELNSQLRQAREALSSRTTELDNLKTEWTSRVNDLSSRHVKEISEEKEKAIQVRILSNDMPMCGNYTET